MIKLILTLFITATFSFSGSLLPEKASIPYVMDYTPETTCLIRNFKIYKSPKWAGKIELQNGKKVFFSSPKSLIEFYKRPGKWYQVGVKSENDMKDIIMTDYLTMKPINGREAFYIYGSRAISPAGDDLVVIENREDADKFAKRHNGKRVFKFDEVSGGLIKLLNGSI